MFPGLLLCPHSKKYRPNFVSITYYVYKRNAFDSLFKSVEKMCDWGQSTFSIFHFLYFNIYLPSGPFFKVILTTKCLINRGFIAHKLISICPFFPCTHYNTCHAAPSEVSRLLLGRLITISRVLILIIIKIMDFKKKITKNASHVIRGPTVHIKQW